MVTNLSITELDLTEFFESFPEKTDRDVSWPYNGLTFNIEVGDESAMFRIHPAAAEIQLSFKRKDHVVYSLSALAIRDLRLLRDGRRETLEIKLGERHRIFVSKQPCLRVFEEFDNDF